MSSRAAFYYFSDIHQAIEQIQTIVGGKTFAEYQASRTERYAVERLLQIITEASIGISEEDKKLCDYSEWRNMRNLGNRLRHAYFTVDDEQIWWIVQDDLPLLKSAVEQTLRDHLPEAPTR